jgi:hypothetical protein
VSVIAKHSYGVDLKKQRDDINQRIHIVKKESKYAYDETMYGSRVFDNE